MSEEENKILSKDPVSKDPISKDSVSKDSVSKDSVSKEKVPKRKGRKPKSSTTAATAATAAAAANANSEQDAASTNTNEVKIPKKRGRKPKGGKIITTVKSIEDVSVPEPNIILHLKCGSSDLNNNHFLTSSFNNSPNAVNNSVETFQFDQPKSDSLVYHVIKTNKQSTVVQDNSDSESESDKMSSIWKKLKELAVNLHTNNISDKKSACFWCTCDFDNPPIFIPKHELNDTYHCYGCFCSPECAAAFLFKEQLDTAIKFERYHLINHLYCKIYNYEKNVKPAPDPYYTLNKYYGNLTIQEYRRLLKNERLLLVVDKPLTRILPELHEDNDDFILNNKSIPSATKYKLRRSRQKQSKAQILNDTFNLKHN